MKLTGENRSTRGKTCPSTTLSTTNPTWTDPGSNPDLHGERPATNRTAKPRSLLEFHIQGKRCKVSVKFISFTLSESKAPKFLNYVTPLMLLNPIPCVPFSRESIAELGRSLDSFPYFLVRSRV
jgi:hypothetical protein